MAIRNQILGALISTYLAVLIGTAFAWPSYTTDLLGSTNTTLSRPMTTTELSLLGSLINIGAFLSLPLVGYFMDKFGRKITTVASGLPFVISWTIIACTSSVELVLFSMFLSGFSGSGQMALCVFIAEISQDSIRGGLTSAPVLGFSIGFLVSYILGGYLTYIQVIYTQLTLSVSFMVFMSFLKESPVYLLQNGDENGAARSIAFYRSEASDSKEVLEEIQNIKRMLNPTLDDEEDNPEEKPLKKDENETEEIKGWSKTFKFLWKSKSSMRALMTCLFVILTSIAMGMVILQVYAEPMFREIIPNLPSNLCSIILAVIMIIAGVLAVLLTDKFGRKPLMLYSSLATGIFSLLIGVQIQLNFAPEWFTALLINLFCLAFNIGAATVPYVLMAEVFLPEVRSLCSTIVLESAWLMNFIVLFAYTPLRDSIGIAAVFYIFTAFCLAATVFSMFWLPETTGLPIDAIQLLFVKNKRKKEYYP